ncbi:PREDICTED: solute carrier organic anion transporter family member 4A1-like [Priapulus caudatus]|uniref:Solute carrier organic anion transporter family member n=1 Tax=Priapulus caudatus TaxID=37621 RepID=A0ABM1DQA5_PRICU|nr:PREDICTED: solute carrier organic anion transporter family member 4A1-like [Priapulus caudatus]
MKRIATPECESSREDGRPIDNVGVSDVTQPTRDVIGENSEPNGRPETPRIGQTLAERNDHLPRLEDVAHNKKNSLVTNAADKATAAKHEATNAETHLRCGWFGWHPSGVQLFNRPGCLLFFMGLCVIGQGALLNGFIPSSVQTIEKRYELSSRQTGIIAALYDADVPARNYLLDDNRQPGETQSLYLGTYLALGAVGPALGYILGGVFVSIYGDLWKIDISNVGVRPGDPQWYGAWWLGPLIASAFALLAAIPILGYAAELPENRSRHGRPGKDALVLGDVAEQERTTFRQALRGPRVSRAWRGSNASQQASCELKDLPASLTLLARNPTYVFIVICDGLEAFMVGGFIHFSPKLLENIFNLTSGSASLIAGAVTVGAAATGIFLGGYIARRLSLRTPGMLKLTILALALSMVSGLGLLITCPNFAFAGVTVPFNDSSETPGFTAACNQHCSCSYEEYNPLCGADNVRYFSPCFAGCNASSDDDGQMVFTNCDCIGTAYGTRGRCDTDCNNLSYFIVVFALFILFEMISATPTQSAILRCVPVSQRSLAVGVQWIVLRLIGGIPGPIVLGAVIDGTCLVWGQKCGIKTSCIQYDSPSLSLRMSMMQLGVKIASCCSALLALLCYKPPRLVKDSTILNTAELPTEDMLPPDDAAEQVGVDTGGLARNQWDRDNPAFVYPVTRAETSL